MRDKAHITGTGDGTLPDLLQDISCAAHILPGAVSLGLCSSTPRPKRCPAQDARLSRNDSERSERPQPSGESRKESR